MNKNDLSDRMVVEFRNGERALVVFISDESTGKCKYYLINDNICINVGIYSLSLTHPKESSLDILSVFLQRENFISAMLNKADMIPYWKQTYLVSTDKDTQVLARDLSKSKKWGKAYYAGNMRVYLPLGANSLSATGTLLISQRDILLYDNNEELVGSTEI